MRPFKPIRRRLGRIGLAFAALVAVAAMSGPAAADNYYRHRHNNGFFSFGYSSPGYYYAPPPAYYYPPPRYYYPPPPAYYYPPPPAYYYGGPSASFNFVVPFGHHH